MADNLPQLIHIGFAYFTNEQQKKKNILFSRIIFYSFVLSLSTFCIPALIITVNGSKSGFFWISFYSKQNGITEQNEQSIFSWFDERIYFMRPDIDRLIFPPLNGCRFFAVLDSNDSAKIQFSTRWIIK